MRTPCFSPVLVGASLLLTACEEPAATPPPPPAEVHLLTEHQWAGGEILIRSDDFLRMVFYHAMDDSGDVVENRWTNLLVIFGEDTLPTRGVDGTTIAATLPRVANGSHPVTVVMDTRTEEIGDVWAYGFASVLRGPMVSGTLLQFPRPSALPHVLVHGPDAVLLVDLASMATQRVLPYSVLGYDPRERYQDGPGWSYRPRSAVIGKRVWQFPTNGAPCLVDSLPIEWDGRGMVDLAPGLWAYLGTQPITQCCPYFSLRCPGGGEVPAVSPLGGLWTPMGYRACTFGPEVPGDYSAYPYARPVFDGNGLVYAVGRRPEAPFMSYYPAFSLTGDTLFVGMTSLPTWYDGGELQVLRAADGEHLVTIPLEHRPLYVAVDPTRPWIYVSAELKTADENWVPTMMVVDRRTMDMVGMPTVPDEAVSWGPGSALYIAAYVADEAVYLSEHGHMSYQITSWRFDLMPPGVEPNTP